MKEFLKDIFPKILQFSKSLDDQTILTNKPWVLFSDDSDTREVWIFKRNHELIFSRDGIADKGSWEYLPEAKSLYIEIGNVKRLINQAFVDDVVLLLRLDGGKGFVTLANELKIDESFRIERYLDDQYQKKQIEPSIPDLLSDPPDVIQTTPLTLEEQIIRQQVDCSTFKKVMMISLTVGLVLMLIFINNTDRQSQIAMLVLSLFIILMTLIIILPIYLKSRKRLKALINQRNVENISIEQ